MMGMLPKNKRRSIEERKGVAVQTTEEEVTVDKHMRITNPSLTLTRFMGSREGVITVGITTRVTHITTREVIITHRTRSNNNTKLSLHIKQHMEATVAEDSKVEVAT